MKKSSEIMWKENGVFVNNPWNPNLYELYSYAWRIEKLTALMKAAERLGFSPEDGGDYKLYMGLHSDRAHFINKLEDFNQGEFVATIWKDGSVHVYNRIGYISNKCGSKAADHLRRRHVPSCLEKPKNSHFRVNGKNRKFGH